MFRASDPPLLTANGIAVDRHSHRFGELRDCTPLRNDAASLRHHIAEHGYLFFRELLPPELVLSARREILQKYAILGEIDDRFDVLDAIAGNGDAVAAANLRAFSASVRGGYWYTQIVESPRITDVVGALLDGSVRPYDFRWPRFVRPGEGCGFHCDGPYMARGTSTDRIFTAWVPLGRVHKHEGALMILEGSNRSERLHAGYLGRDADDDALTWLTSDPNALCEQHGGRWLSADFEAGDVLIITMHTIHGALDNRSPVRRCRLSSDTRYQRADEPFDPRWNGEDPDAHGGSRVFYPGLGSWDNADFQDEWKYVNERGQLLLPPPTAQKARDGA